MTSPTKRAAMATRPSQSRAVTKVKMNEADERDYQNENRQMR